MECNFSQVQKDFKFSIYKGHPTIKITVPPSPPSPLQLSLIIKWCNHFRSPTWKSEVNILLCTCTKHVSISHHLHSYEKSLFIYLPLQFDKNKVEISYRTIRPFSLNSAQTFQLEIYSLQKEQTICFNILQKKRGADSEILCGVLLQLFSFCDFLSFDKQGPILNYWGNCIMKGR